MGVFFSASGCGCGQYMSLVHLHILSASGCGCVANEERHVWRTQLPPGSWLLTCKEEGSQLLNTMQHSWLMIADTLAGWQADGLQCYCCYACILNRLVLSSCFFCCSHMLTYGTA